MTSLDALSRSYGIQDSAKDAKGQDRVTPAGAKLAMLAAMGVDAFSEEAALASIKALEDAEWRNPVPPVLVAYSDAESVQIPIVRPAETEVVHWLITFEDGKQRCGESSFADLVLLGERDARGQTMQRRSLTISGPLTLGYHRFQLASEHAEMSLIVTPGKCWLPVGVARADRYWGIAAQLYLLRSEHNWGIGDFTDLKQLIEAAERAGADVVGVNPLHAMFPDRSENASPYSPSDRNLLNILNIDVEAIPEFLESPEALRLVASADFKLGIAKGRQSDRVAYSEVAALKLQALKTVFDAFRRNKSVTRHMEFNAFIEERASLLERACIFQALRSYFTEVDPDLADSNNWQMNSRVTDRRLSLGGRAITSRWCNFSCGCNGLQTNSYEPPLKPQTEWLLGCIATWP